MKHFVSYHNADKMGYAYEDALPFSVGTTKSVDRLVGNRVWSISGEGKPRTYRLRDTYIVDSIGESDQEQFVNFACGSNGIAFEPPVVLNRLPWFPAFLKSQSNFSLGLQQIKDEFVAHFEALTQSPRKIGSTMLSPDEVEPGKTYREGTVVSVTVNAYERNPIARKCCIDHYGPTCVVCGFIFGLVYGSLAEGFIHVHHIKPLSEIGEEYEVDPVADLRPVCANCHAIIHLGGGCRSIEQARHLVDPRVLEFWASLAKKSATAAQPRG